MRNMFLFVENVTIVKHKQQNHHHLLLRLRIAYKNIAYSIYENDLNQNTKYGTNDLLNANLNYDINLIGKIKICVDYDNEYYYFKK